LWIIFFDEGKKHAKKLSNKKNVPAGTPFL